MRKIILLLSLCVSVCLSAEDGKTSTKRRRSLNEIEKRDSKPEPQKLATKLTPQQRLTEARRIANAEIATKQVTPTKNAVASTYYRLDSMVTRDINGDVYAKIEYAYNDDYSDASYTTISKDWNTSELMTTESISMEYTDEGYLSARITYSYSMDNGELITNGDRWDYTYNEKGLKTEEMLSLVVRSDIFMPEFKLNYIYDDRGYAIDIYHSNYNAKSGEWTKTIRSVANFDDYGRVILLIDYEWNGTEWIPQGDLAKREYEYDSKGRVIADITYRFNASTKKWGNYYQKVREWDKNDNIKFEKELYWNETDQDWTGYVQDPGTEWEMVLYTNQTVYEYNDPKNRETREVFSKLINGEWVDFYSIEYTYVDVPGLNAESGQEITEGSYQFTKLGFNHETGVKTEDTKYIAIQGPINASPSYEKEWKKIGETWRALYELKYEYYGPGEYDYNGIDWLYTKDEANTRYGERKQVVTLDNNNLPVESFHYEGVYNRTGEGKPNDDWMILSRFEYTHAANGVRTGKVKYVYDDAGVESLESIDREEYDFNTLVTSLIIPELYGFDYKILKMHNSSSWGDYFDKSYHYTEIQWNGGSGIEDAANNVFSVYPNPATDVININAEGDVTVSIYNLQGARILQSTEKQVNVSTLVPGSYVVDVNGIKTKLMKK
ncbi:T9SS type A sorting domain-containing protein [Dysgonomonas sp. 520]|uniref:T9SS type A sorting domain-containing protein n=1 Tax=Dysgonomonas sp. 520 TaxID=2302931 RepID=UPI0013D236F6|nr:T9SS type A sorting domain-containing protein [Dysgonomonas sp. 520]